MLQIQVMLPLVEGVVVTGRGTGGFGGGVLILFSFLIRVLVIQGCYLCLNALTFRLMICKLI